MPQYSADDLYAALRATAEIVGHAPTADEYREHAPADAPTARTIISRHKEESIRRAGRGQTGRPWMIALAGAGLDVDPVNHFGFKWARREALEGVWYVASLEAAWPSPYRYRRVFREQDLTGIYPSRTAIDGRIFDDWGDAIEAGRAANEALATLVDEGPSQVDVKRLRESGAVWQKLRIFTSSRVRVYDICYLAGHSVGEVIDAALGAIDVGPEEILINRTVQYAPAPLREALSERLRLMQG